MRSKNLRHARIRVTLFDMFVRDTRFYSIGIGRVNSDSCKLVWQVLSHGAPSFTSLFFPLRCSIRYELFVLPHYGSWSIWFFRCSWVLTSLMSFNCSGTRALSTIFIYMQFWKKKFSVDKIMLHCKVRTKINRQCCSGLGQKTKHSWKKPSPYLFRLNSI